MTKLQEHLYLYIMEDRYASLYDDSTYTLVRHRRDAAEARLTASMTKKQKMLFDRYMSAENRVIGLQFQHIFQETLGIVHDILNISL